MKSEKKAEISLERIVETAITLLNRNGIEKLSMRTLAAELDIKAASLYWHIKDKQELYDQIAETMSRRMLPSCGLKNAKAYLLSAAGLYRKELLEVRDSAEVFRRSPPGTPARIELIRNILICLLHTGIKEENCMIAAHLFNNYILSFAADEAVFEAGKTSGPDPFAGILGTDHTPLTGDAAFALGLDVLFTGFRILE